MEPFDSFFEDLASWNEYVDPEFEYPRQPHAESNGAGERPGDDFNRRAPWPDVLEPKGWAVAGHAGETVYWRRPGKEGPGWSATTGKCKNEKSGDLLYVFSSNAAPFEPETPYNKFSAYGLLYHEGDFAAAARELRQKGYGTPDVYEGVKVTMPSAGANPTPVPDFEPADVATIADLRAGGAAVTWLWEWWIQLGVLTAVAAPGGTGKTRFCADLLRRIRHRQTWPDGTGITVPHTSTALWVVADNHHDEMVTLAEAFGIEDGIWINASKADPYGGVTLETAEDLALLEARVKAVRPLLVVVDTVGNATDKNLSKQEDAKAFYWPLQIIARKYRCAVMPLTHLNATGQFLGRRVLEKVRVAIKLEQPDQDNERRRMEVSKTNSKTPPALGLTMGDHGNQYDNNPPERAAEEPGMGGKRGPAPEKVEACKKWLAEWLQHGAKKVGITRDEAEKKLFSVGVLYRAKDALDIAEFTSEGRKWWRLGEDES